MSGPEPVIPTKLRAFRGWISRDLKGPGVYFLVDQGEVVYVGKSLRTEKRVVQHMVNAEYVFDDVLFLSGPAENIDAFERAIIAIYQPRYNTRVDRYSPAWILEQREQLGFGQPEFRKLLALGEIVESGEAEAALGLPPGQLEVPFWRVPYLLMHRRPNGRYWVTRDALLEFIVDADWRRLLPW